MAKITIEEPAANAKVGRTFRIKGTLRAQREPERINSVHDIHVSIVETGEVYAITPQTGPWERIVTIKPNNLGVSGGKLPVTVEASGVQTTWTIDDNGRVINPRTDPFTVRTQTAVTVDTTPPILTISPYPSEVTPESLPYRLNLSGSARDSVEHSGIIKVEYKLNDAVYALPDNTSARDWTEWKELTEREWEKTINLQWEKTLDLPARENQILIRAVDGFGNVSQPEELFISVRVPFRPLKPELALEPITYLQDLIWFALTWIDVGDTDQTLDARTLAARFLQPFDVLPNSYELATRPIQQARIAIEVLRKLRKQTGPAEIEQRFNRQVYEALLLQFGTSYEELRLARIEDLKVRVALAERLGLGSKDAGLNRLARITLAPDQINAEQLEQVFGFEATTHDDPLRSSLANSEILTWRLAVTRQQWVLEDSQARDAADGPMPIIDPDLVGEENLITKTAGDPVYDLWKRRKTWLDNKHAEAQHERQQGFDHVIHTFIGDINIAALASRDENGENISDELKALKLDLAAFRSLAKYQKLSASLEDWEWQDILDIAVQVQKKRQYQEWRTDEIRLSESGFSLSPEHFRLPDLQSTTGPQSLTSQSWRATRRAYVAWRKTLALRGKQLQDVKNTYQSALETVEAHVLPLLRDWLIGVAKEGPAAADEVLEIAEELSHTLLIDFRANTTQTTRLNQAIETLQAALLSVRAGRLATDSPNTDWNIRAESDFDQEWKWMASYKTWRAAMMAFAYPENQLYPYLFVPNEPFLDPTVSFLRFIERVRKTARMTAEDAGNAAQTYLKELREQSGLVLPPELQEKEFLITETNDPVKRKKLIEKLFADRQVTKPHAEPNYLFEIFWLVPMALAMQLQKNGRYLTALDWYQTVYAFNLPEKDRKVYKGLELEGEIKTAYHRVPEWLVKELNPHIFARSRKNAYTRFTVMAIVQCFLDYADSEFTQNTVETVGRARTLYETAADLLNLADAAPGKEATSLFLSNPIWEALKTYAHANLTKIRNGMNIAGIPTAMQVMSGPAASLQPSQYRYSVLGERAKQLVSIAQQVESSFLSTMEREEAERYSRLQAGHDLQVAKSTVSLQVLKITDADLALQTAHLQQEKTRIQADYYEDRISEGLNSWEQTSLTSMKIAAYLQTSAGVMHAVDAGKDTVTAILTLGFFGSPAEKIGQALSALADAASSTAGMAQAIASYQRREEEWRHQKSLSDKDVQISGQQILLAQNQRAITIQERDLSVSQLDHAAAVVNFLLNKFLNAELYEWMSGVLGRVYNYFLQQATAIAQLAQSQLAFERQEPALSVIQSDYWQVTSDESWAGQTAAAGPDRRGLTGSARLLQDIYKLDQYAFETKQRKLQLTQTLSLAQMAPLELQIFRDTGKLLFATPMELFDRDFPGHYLRLIRRVRVSVVALVPPTRGVRATLSASGISRVVTSGETFETIEIRRSSETIAFTSPLNATGLFELESDGELLLPFEGMGVDTFWELQLPKAANPFDYRAIADVLLTIEYTALFNSVYRQQVIKKLDSEISSDRMFSLREQFPDAWYDLNNGDAIENVDDRMVATFSTRREDFPPHIEDLQIQEITLLVARRDGFMEEIDIQKLTFTPEGKTDLVGVATRTVGGVVSTRRSNGQGWQWREARPISPIGSWKIQLRNTSEVMKWFKEGQIEDLALLVTFGGTTRAWPV